MHYVHQHFVSPSDMWTIYFLTQIHYWSLSKDRQNRNYTLCIDTFIPYITSKM